MTKLHITFKLVIILCITNITQVFAAEQDAKATFFSKIYMNLCMKNINDFEVLRADLTTKFPKFPIEQAARFLNGKDGDAWPITTSLGNFVISITKGVKSCAVYAQKAAQDEVETKFIEFVAIAPSPLISEKRTDEIIETTVNGKAHTLAYVWSAPSAKTKMMFALTTSSKADAQIQALATASIISD
jgi:hypothetical protein